MHARVMLCDWISWSIGRHAIFSPFLRIHKVATHAYQYIAMRYQLKSNVVAKKIKKNLLVLRSLSVVSLRASCIVHPW